MMYLNGEGGAYSSAIATVIDDRIILNWNSKDVGPLVETNHEKNYRVTRKQTLLGSFIEWFKRTDEKYQRRVILDMQQDNEVAEFTQLIEEHNDLDKDDLVETMKGLQR